MQPLLVITQLWLEDTTYRWLNSKQKEIERTQIKHCIHKKVKDEDNSFTVFLIKKTSAIPF